MRKTYHPLAAAILAALFFLNIGLQAQSKIKAFVGATLVNPEGAASIERAVILVEGNKIIQVGKAGKVRIPKDAELIKAEGKWIIPGLIDSHIHFFQSGGLYTRPDIIDLRKFVPYVDQELAQIKKLLPDTFARYLRCGITSVLDMGGPLWNFQVRELAGKTDLAPRVFVAGPLISTYQPAALTTDDPPIIKVNTVEEALRLVHDQVDKKTDFIKIWYIVREGETVEKNYPMVKAVIDESHRLGKRGIVHATQLETAKAAVKAGADILAHLVSDKPVDAEFIQMVKKRGVICSTTVVVNEGYTETLSQNVELSLIEQELANPYVVSTLFDPRHLPAEVVPKVSEEQMNNRKNRLKLNQQNLLALQKAGVTIAANTDAGNIGTLHGPALFREFALMAEAGLTPMQVLTAATINNARLLGRQDTLGTLKKNKLADFVVLNSDPRQDIRNAGDIHLVVKDGRVFLPAEIVKKSAADTVQQQLNAYNGRDIEAFLATYAPGIKVYDHPDQLLHSSLEEMRKNYQMLFRNNPALHVQIMNRIVQGDLVIDQERITGRSDQQVKNAVIIYQVQNGKIQRAWIMRE